MLDVESTDHAQPQEHRNGDPVDVDVADGDVLERAAVDDLQGDSGQAPLGAVDLLRLLR